MVWRKLKYEGLRPEDYADEDALRLAVWTTLTAVGKSLNIAFSPFKKILEHSLTSFRTTTYPNRLIVNC